MSDIGVRELKIHASEIVRQVKEKGAHYVVTHRGRPVAMIIPVEEAHPLASAGPSAWDELVSLGQQISLGWQSPHSSTDILSEMRE
jgi:prevent-host-death family protein